MNLQAIKMALAWQKYEDVPKPTYHPIDPRLAHPASLAGEVPARPHARFVSWLRHTEFIPSLRSNWTEGCDSNINSTQGGPGRSPTYAFYLSDWLSALTPVSWVGLGIGSSFHV